MSDTVTFTMRLDASDLKSLIGSSGITRAQRQQASGGGTTGGSAASGGGGGGGGSGFFGRLFGGQSSDGQKAQDAQKQARANATDPTFKSIFKPLAVLTIVNKTLSGLLRNSQIANTYGAAMGKIFGAAMDILLVPFLPFFNLLLVAMTKLLAWLITSGVLEEISKIVSRATGYLEAIAHWIVEVWHAIKSLDFGKLAQLLISGLGNAVKTAVKDPLGAAMTGGLALVGGSLMMGMLNKLTFGLAGKALGLPFKLAGKGVGKLFGGLGGGAAEGTAAGGAEAGIAGGGAAAAEAGGGAAAAGAAGAGEAAAGGSGMASLLTFGGLGAGSLALAGGAGLAGGLGANYLAGKAGIHGTARQALTGAAAGAAGGAVIGSVVPVLGTAVGAIGGGLIGGGIGLAKGLLGGGGGDKQQQQAGSGIVNSNNTINFTQNNTYGSNVNQKQIADDAIKEIERRTGFKLAVRGGH